MPLNGRFLSPLPPGWTVCDETPRSGRPERLGIAPDGPNFEESVNGGSAYSGESRYTAHRDAVVRQENPCGVESDRCTLGRIGDPAQFHAVFLRKIKFHGETQEIAE